MTAAMSYAPSFYVQSDEVQLAVYQRGNPAQPTVIFIHGYPDNHEVWDKVVALLEDEFHVVTYDVRGSGASSLPKRIRDYTLAKLSQDLQAVMNAVSPDRPVHLVAHDWGSIQTWESVTDPALQHRIASYSTLSGPCLDHVGKLLRRYISQPNAEHLSYIMNQALHSWYIFMFQAPLLAPTIWRAGLAKHWHKVLAKIENVKHAEPNPNQLIDGVNGIQLYRANMLPRVLAPRARYSAVPINLLVALDDHFVRPHLYNYLEEWAPNLERTEIQGGHWQLLLDQPEVFADAVRQFIKRY
ncbi:alpha/beta fold hydrolase [Agitococcus lubricus]|uniref:Pimeloyl-ACP methyl ester carboxylesterase n=1 Tax=Agitococcus lubricus TaxID=1077255 RepID=A0A2T5IYC1_9GAMM|nr:alpha/beta fold hydrolase [Agitococcus lubricus]PTQ88947.1 pimeloyl-ACP methyl ester carboxylesterase [Agitococcus lubricus]